MSSKCVFSTLVKHTEQSTLRLNLKCQGERNTKTQLTAADVWLRCGSTEGLKEGTIKLHYGKCKMLGWKDLTHTRDISLTAAVEIQTNWKNRDRDLRVIRISRTCSVFGSDSTNPFILAFIALCDWNQAESVLVTVWISLLVFCLFTITLSLCLLGWQVRPPVCRNFHQTL